ncbi:hypothetical protein GCM10011363_01410 [Marivita lacus]|uniref:PRC-barrel domain-containing protein n=1 Tax=Marivita lacus TaxID=1323742 RepID=A0ABQ1KB22_9RHOB|nr:PRC-barrel domain-containing protein [Marivita lacus]GGB88537.1 hypothetical protein GCM10011363_01410 [Marivita lacus]
MTKLIASALALTIGATGAWAESHTSGNMDSDSASTTISLENRDDLIRTRDITGGDIYTMNAASDEGWSMDTLHTEVGSNWNDIGEIEDIILNKNGQMIGIVAEIGGFLDIADKHVMIPVSDVNLVAVDDRSYAFLTKYSEEELEERESVDEGFWD